ncbi:MAG TPA: NADH-quinone oxidoreductase subunit L [Chitinophagaceae bacterium]|nr:NADH-quinone oxidoreductase subunit L [Chitinophagaceae bacterium]
MNYASYIALIPLLPLASFVLLGLFGRKYFKNFAGTIGTIVLLAITVLSFITAYQYFFIDGKVNDVYQSVVPLKYTWLQFSPNLSIDMGIVLDPISVMMLVVISFVSLMVHIFSIGYMKGEERFSTYYAFLSLFTFSMLGLVVSTNIFQVYFFWELVGISSYLLIGFYFDKPAAVAASKKAFIVTRFADLGFLIGILILAFHAETLDFITLIERLTTIQSSQFSSITTSSFLGISLLTWALTLVFIGGAGKSAMFPLHVWLPDAMEGPTPVSALIHAATMVVAGVYLVARLFPLYSLDVAALHIIAYVGAISALLAAVIACTQTDIKRVLAYSTISQIGYMMFALGVSGYGGENGLGYMASMFHLFTHAFFKSLLFLCAGAVIHFVHSNEMNDMGGLRKLMPLTHIAFLIACFAIAGIPPFSGFFSKEEILTAAYHSNKFIYGIGVFTSMLTAFYMFRLYFMIFHHKQPHIQSHHGEGSLSMKFPLAVLAICTLASAFVPFTSYVTSDGVPFATHVDIIFSILPVTLSVTAILFAAKLYYRQNELPNKMAASLGTIYRTAYRKFYIDEVYLFITKKIIFNLVGKPAAWIDKHVVDGFMNLLATITGKVSAFIKGLQSGKVQNYALYFFGGIAGLTVLFVWLWR